MTLEVAYIKITDNKIYVPVVLCQIEKKKCAELLNYYYYLAHLAYHSRDPALSVYLDKKSRLTDTVCNHIMFLE